MIISKDEARCILCLAEISWNEGLGADNDTDLCRRIIIEFPDIAIPTLVKIFLER